MKNFPKLAAKVLSLAILGDLMLTSFGPYVPRKCKYPIVMASGPKRTGIQYSI